MAKRLALSGLVALLVVGGWVLWRPGREAGPLSKTTSEASAADVSVPQPSESGLVTAPGEPERTPSTAAVPTEEREQGDPAAPEELLWFGRVVDGETQVPLVEALFEVVEGDPSQGVAGVSTPVRPDGSVELRFPRPEFSVVAFECPGYAMGLIAPEPEHGELSKAQVVALRRAATARVRVRDERLHVSGPAVVQILAQDRQLFLGRRSVSSGNEFVWGGQPEGGGILIFEDLAPGVALTLEALDGEKSLRRETLVFEPGERREIELVLRNGCGIAGRALTPAGKPVSGLEIWLVQQPSLLRPYFDTFEDTQGRTRTDERGEFLFDDVAPGEWFVGPAGKQQGESFERVEAGNVHGGYAGDPIAPMAVQLIIQPGDGVVPVTLTCWSGLYIRGRVIDSLGQAAGEASVDALAPGIWCDGQADSNGSFVVGPLVPGVYSLSADRFEGMDYRSDSVEGRPGDEKVELRLRLGGAISVTVYDEQGRPASRARVTLASSESESNGRSTRVTGDDGQIEIAGVSPGLYALIATRGNEVGVQTDVAVEAGVRRTGPNPKLAPGVKMTIVRPNASTPVVFRVLYGGFVLTTGRVGPDMEPSIHVPPGEIEVELVRAYTSPAFKRKTVIARAGEQMRVEFTEGDGGE